VLTDGKGRIVSIPMHKGTTLKQGTARAILEQVGIDEDAFFDEY
jgi:predicted RNA binding protein YcfA (HicA-like mRNA interferase family)